VSTRKLKKTVVLWVHTRKPGLSRIKASTGEFRRYKSLGQIRATPNAALYTKKHTRGRGMFASDIGRV